MGKHKKWVVLLSYSGLGYYGMQRQTCDNKIIENLPTIESELFKAFFESGLINEKEMNNPNIMRFQRAARTDKGVSAAKQIISLQLAGDMKDYLSKINEILPTGIQIFSAKRATKYFDSKNFCDARTYSYLLPSYTICPANPIDDKLVATKTQIEKFNSLLNMFIGTHNFHNFTAGKKPNDASAKRFIISFECSDPLILGDNDNKREFLIIKVKGQSFMLHQIRKMVGLAIAVMRELADQSVITRAFGDERLDVPIAPGLGLLLEEVHYERYNKKYGNDGVHEPLLWEEVEEQILDFKNKYIYSKIIETEINEKSMLDWLKTLPVHTFGIRDNPVNLPLGLSDQAKVDNSRDNSNTKDDLANNDIDKTDDVESKSKKIKI